MTEHICPKCGKDEVAVCPECGKPVEVYSRVVGYLRPIKTWNPGKQQEFAERKEYLINHGDHIE
jgi:ribonucleoside-triphosphate reductase (formate)